MYLLLNMAISLCLTLVFELAFVFACGINRKKDLGLAAMVNVLTNPPVVFLYYLSSGSFGAVPVTLVLETAAVLVEWKCYDAFGENIPRPFLLSLSANAFSYSMGRVLGLARGGPVPGLDEEQAKVVFALIFAHIVAEAAITYLWRVRDGKTFCLIGLCGIVVEPVGYLCTIVAIHYFVDRYDLLFGVRSASIIETVGSYVFLVMPVALRGCLYSRFAPSRIRWPYLYAVVSKIAVAIVVFMSFLLLDKLF